MQGGKFARDRRRTRTKGERNPCTRGRGGGVQAEALTATETVSLTEQRAMAVLGNALVNQNPGHLQIPRSLRCLLYGKKM